MKGVPRSRCTVACTLDLVGDRWTLLVLRDLFAGAERFEQLLASNEAIATNVLSERLKRLRAAEMVTVEADPENGRRKRYRLTERGRDFAPVLLELARWGLRHIPGVVGDPRVGDALKAAIAERRGKKR